MNKYKVLIVSTKYWKPHEDYLKNIVHAVAGKIADGDFLVISEKAISTAKNNIADEEALKPSINARIIARLWMPIIWGYFLGVLCRFQRKTIEHLRDYPFECGSRHKQLALQRCGLLQALMFGSEGGIDGSNLPYSFVSLTLENAEKVAEDIHAHLRQQLRKKAGVLIVDTDKTYSMRGFHFTPRPKPIKGIVSFGGVFSYVAGRMLKLRRRATPVAVAGCRLNVETALEIASIANRARSYGAGRTVWDMAEKFDTGLAQVTWEMLETVKHKPIVIVRRKR
jgi:F420-0:gamma-glutamyl ligase-like protein